MSNSELMVHVFQEGCSYNPALTMHILWVHICVPTLMAQVLWEAHACNLSLIVHTFLRCMNVKQNSWYMYCERLMCVTQHFFFPQRDPLLGREGKLNISTWFKLLLRKMKIKFSQP